MKSLAARLVAKTSLDDIAEGSVMLQILSTVAEELEAIEFRLSAIRDSFSFETAVGADLDERAADLPPPGITRKGKSRAVGAALKFTRTDTTASVTIPAGTKFKRTDGSKLVYTLTQAVTLGVGVSEYPAAGGSFATVVCDTLGAEGNAGKGIIQKFEDEASFDGLTVTQEASVGGGQERETDEQLRARCIGYLSSLAKVQPIALENFALGFEFDEGNADGGEVVTSIKHVSLKEFPEKPGYSELVVDDGSGMSGFRRTADSTSGTAPAGGQVTLWFDSPVTIDTNPVVKVNGSQISSTAYRMIEERGILKLSEAYKLDSGDTWNVSGHEVYTGPIATLQKEIEGEVNNGFAKPGLRAAGTRVRVIGPEVINQFEVKIQVLFKPYTDATAVKATMKTLIINFLRDTKPGDPIFVSNLYHLLIDNVDQIINLKVLEPAEDYYVTERQVVRIGEDQIQIVATQE